MQKINERQKEKIFELVNKMTSDIERIKKEIDDTQNTLRQFCEEENLQVYFMQTTDERLHEAKIRLDMAKTRLSEFKGEAKCMQLSTNGFY